MSHDGQDANSIGEINAQVYSLAREPLCDIAEAILTAYVYGRTIYVASDSDATCTANYLVRKLRREFSTRPQQRKVVELIDISTFRSVWTNKEGERQVVRGHFRNTFGQGDVMIGLGDGSVSPALKRLLHWAGSWGAVTVGLIRREDVELMRLTDHCLVIPNLGIDQEEFIGRRDAELKACDLIIDGAAIALTRTINNLQGQMRVQSQPFHSDPVWCGACKEEIFRNHA